MRAKIDRARTKSAQFADKFPAVFHVSVVGFVGTKESKYGVEFSTGRRGVNFDGDRKWGRFIGNGRVQAPSTERRQGRRAFIG